MLSFKDFLADVKKGHIRRDLFIVVNAATRKFYMQQLVDEAYVLQLDPHVSRADGVISFGEAFAMFRIAHPFLTNTLRGMTLTGIQGLDCLDEYENADEAKATLKAQVR